MLPEQERHLNHIQERAEMLIDAKYRKGAQQHQSVLNRDYTSHELLHMAIDEAVDQVVYLLTLAEKMEDSPAGVCPTCHCKFYESYSSHLLKCRDKAIA